MQKLIWTNSKGDSIDLTSGVYGITNWEGFSNSSLNIQSQQVPFHDGSVFLDALIEPRELSVTLALNDNGDLHKRYKCRRELISILNPKLGEGYLIYKNDFVSKRIKCTPQIPISENHNSNDIGTPKLNLSWTACNPYWEDLEESHYILRSGLRKKIVNNGDVPCAMNIRFLNTDVLHNPIIENINSGKFVKLNGNFNSFVNVNTNTGFKNIISEDLSYVLKNFIMNINSICYSEKLNLFVVVGYTGNNAQTYRGQLLTSSDGINWKFINSDSDIKFLYDVVYSEELNLFVAVGSSETSGIILTSSDGITWESQTNEMTKLKCITYSKELNLFVIGNQFSNFLTSSDGITWVNHSTSVGKNLNSICYSEDLNLFVAVGSSGTILTSSDGINWHNHSTGENVLRSICYSEKLNLFVIVGQNGTILTSLNGTTWTSQTSQTSNSLTCIIYSEELNLFIIVGSEKTILTSLDGITWISFESNIFLSEICYSKKLGMFVGGSSAFLSTSTDYLYWEYVTNYNYNFISQCYSKKLNLYIISGGYGSFISSDGINWTKISLRSSQNSICYSEKLNLFVAVTNDGYINVSSNGIEWNESRIPSYYLNSICYSEKLNLFVAVGYILNQTSGIILTSSDGINWTEIFISDSVRKVYLNSICYSEKLNLFAAVGYSSSSGPDNNYVFTSSNGINWDKKYMNSRLNSICYSEELNLFVIAGSNIFTSFNGMDWYEIYTQKVNYIIYSEKLNLFVAGGDDGILLLSSDGINWKKFKFTNSNFICLLVAENFMLCSLSDAIIETFFTKLNNEISKISSDSDMTLNLSVGDNNLLFNVDSGTLVAEITYRQKYVGV